MENLTSLLQENLDLTKSLNEIKMKILENNNKIKQIDTNNININNIELNKQLIKVNNTNKLNSIKF